MKYIHVLEQNRNTSILKQDSYLQNANTLYAILNYMCLHIIKISIYLKVKQSLYKFISHIDTQYQTITEDECNMNFVTQKLY